MPTTAGGLPYPDYSDDPDGPAQLQALAEELDTQLAAKSDDGHTHVIVDVTDLTAVLADKSDTSHSHSALANRKSRMGDAFITTNVYGTAQISHTLGVAPEGGVFSARISGGTGAQTIGTIRFYDGEQTSSIFKVRCFDVAGDPLNAVSFTLQYIIW